MSDQAKSAFFSGLQQNLDTLRGQGLYKPERVLASRQGAEVVAEDGRPQGIFTDGDLRRLIERGADLRALTAAEVMHTGPRLVSDGSLAVAAAGLMEQHRITSVLVVDDAGLLVGALNTNDLMRAKVI